MSKRQEALLLEWEDLLKAVREAPGDFGCVDPLVGALSDAHVKALTYKALRDSLRSSGLEATQCLVQALAEGEEKAIRLRAFVRSRLGHQNEKLRRYGIKPRGSRRSRRGRRPAA